MRDDDILNDAPHSSRAHIAELLGERRVELSNGIVARLQRRQGVCV
ncbi:MAG: hypothetical protein QOD51_2090, partial [Candidatus Eremiobacteraeota bacterium]|nr:hypothetical protein [Candidatus Eremiobacteraeota bacterium]